MSDDSDAPPFRPPDARMIPTWQSVIAPEQADPASPARHRRARDAVADEPEPAGDEEPAVRPFVLTGGRTRAGDNLRLETLLQAVPGTLPPTLRFESRQIVDLCRSPASIADVAATLRVPLGVVRVLVSDLVAIGHLAPVRTETLSVQTIERLRDRVRSL